MHPAEHAEQIEERADSDPEGNTKANCANGSHSLPQREAHRHADTQSCGRYELARCRAGNTTIVSLLSDHGNDGNGRHDPENDTEQRPAYPGLALDPVRYGHYWDTFFQTGESSVTRTECGTTSEA